MKEGGLLPLTFGGAGRKRRSTSFARERGRDSSGRSTISWRREKARGSLDRRGKEKGEGEFPYFSLGKKGGSIIFRRRGS